MMAKIKHRIPEIPRNCKIVPKSYQKSTNLTKMVPILPQSYQQVPKAYLQSYPKSYLNKTGSDPTFRARPQHATTQTVAVLVLYCRIRPNRPFFRTHTYSAEGEPKASATQKRTWLHYTNETQVNLSSTVWYRYVCKDGRQNQGMV